jgi:hypothetical protein
MKLIVLHGENVIKSYERLTKFIETAKKRDWEIYEYKKENGFIGNILRSQGLFESSKLITVYGFSTLTKADILWLKDNSEVDATVVVYVEGKLLTKTQINSLQKGVVEEAFPLPKKVWALIDSIYPGNSNRAIGLLSNVVPTEAPVELVVALVARQLRDIYAVMTHQDQGIPSWKRSKLLSVSSKFVNQNQAILFLEQLALLDISMKTTSESTYQQLAFYLIKNLQ